MRQIKVGPGPDGEVAPEYYVNFAGWFGRCWLMQTMFCSYIVEADSESDAIDAFVDSDHGSQIRCSDECPHDPAAEDCDCSFAGNYGERVDLEHVRLEQVEVLVRIQDCRKIKGMDDTTIGEANGLERVSFVS